MLKKPLIFFFISFFMLATACAPKPKTALPPPVYADRALSLPEIVSRISDGIEAVKVVADVKIEKDGRPLDSVSASILIKRPDRVHVRIYKFGMLMKNFIIKEDELYVLSGKGGMELKKLGSELYNAVFWWERMSGADIKRSRKEYIIHTAEKKLRLDRATLLPLKQEVLSTGGRIKINYSKPRMMENGFWYPSVINIFLNEFKFRLNVKRLLRNPSLGEFDFNVPEADIRRPVAGPRGLYSFHAP